MFEIDSWHASLKEHRAAWIIATLCLLLMLIISIKPDLFEWKPSLVSKAHETVAPTNNSSSPMQEAEMAAESTLSQEEPAEPEVDTPPAVITPASPAPKPAPAAQAPAPAKARTVAPTASQQSHMDLIGSGYYIQLGAFSELPRAQGMADQISIKGWHSVVYRKGNVHAVWAGPVATRSEAEKNRKAIEQQLQLKGFIVQHP